MNMPKVLKKKLTVWYVLALLLSASLFSSWMTMTFFHQASANPTGSRINVEIYPRGLIKAYVNETITLLALVHNGSSPFTYRWYVDIDFPPLTLQWISSNDSQEAVFIPFAQSSNATLIFQVEVYDSQQNFGYASSMIIDPATINVYLDDIPDGSTFSVQTDGTFYWATRFDGTKSYETTDFGSTVNSAIDAYGGGRIYVGQGTFTFTASTGIDIDQEGTTLEGSGYDTLILAPAGFNDQMIHVTADYAKIKNMRLDGQDLQGAAYDGILLDGAGNGGLDVDNVWVEDCGQDGIHLGDDDATWEGNYAKMGNHLVSSSNGRYGIYFSNDASDSELHDFLVKQHNGAGDAGIRVEAPNVRINTGHCWGNTYEMVIAELDSVSGLLVNTVGFQDGSGTTAGSHRVYHSSETYRFLDSSFVNCEFWVSKLTTDNASDGFHCEGIARGITIQGCVFRGTDEDGTPTEGRYAIYMDASVNYVSIVGCTIRNFGMADPIYTTGVSNLEEAHNVVFTYAGY